MHIKKNLDTKALIITWSGFQDHELVYPYYRLLGASIETTIVADKMDEQGRIYGIFGLNMPCHMTISDFNSNHSKFLNDYSLLVIPGGVKSLEKLRQDAQVIEFISKWNKLDKLIASTCHGAQMLISAGITRGKNISGYYSLKVDIENSGANYINQPVVVDGNIISSPHYDYMGEWMEVVISKLEGN